MTDFFIPVEFDFGQQFDRSTLTRAMALEPERAMLSMQIAGPLLLTRLRGSGSSAYEQRIELPVDRRLGLQVRGHCSCPVGLNCKHVAAALMAFEALQIRQQKNPGAVTGLALVQQPTPAVAAIRESPGRLPQALLLWLAELAHTETRPAKPDVAPAAKREASRQLMYVLRPRGTQLQLQFYLGKLRKSGRIGSHRRHAGPIADMLRTRPSYLDAADPALLAALLPLLAVPNSATLLLRGHGAAAALRELVASGRTWWLDSSQDTLPTPPGPTVGWLNEAVALSLHWRADAAGQWRTCWHGPGDRPVQLILLPEPHLFDPERLMLQPARIDGPPLGSAVTDWLARMPAVPAELLPLFAERLQSTAAARHLELPLPDSHGRQVQRIDAARLEPVLRLSTCVDVASEALLHETYGSPAARSVRQRQASAQLLFRYRPSDSAAVEFHFPAGAAETVFVDVPGEGRLLRFKRDAEAEAKALQTLFTSLDMRPWSVTAGLALDRMTRLNAGRLQSSVLPPALEGKPLLLVPRRRDQWPALLAHGFAALEREGWHVAADDDFPFETHDADQWELDVVEAPGRDWFGVGLKVTVEGRSVNLLPLLIQLVQSGWLEPDAGPRSARTTGNGLDSSDEPGAPGGGDVLVPWPFDEPAAPGHAPRQRLLRLPIGRVAPLMDWLRSVFRLGDPKAALQISRFDVGTLEALSVGAKVNAPPSFVELMQQLQNLRSGHGLPPVVPSAAVRATLRGYQLDGLAWMNFMRRTRLGGVLADDMGLGKTLQALALLQGELDAGRIDRPSLVIVPTSLLGNWQAEATRFTPELQLVVLHGPRRIQQFERIAQAHLVVTSYPLAVRDIVKLAAQSWHYLILDEAQRIKNSRSQAAVAVKGLQARHRLGLSGTPLENHLGELWSLMDFVCPGLLGTEARFREYYRSPIEKRHDERQAELLARRVRPFILRRTKQQVARELPAKTETLLRVELAGAQADLYETVRATMDKKLRDAIARQGLARSQIMVLDALLKLRQVCCDPRLLKGVGPGAARSAASAKMELLLDLLPTMVEDGRRVLLFSQFTEMLALIEAELARLKLSYLKLTGETRDRAAVVAEFQHGEVPIFLISLKAGGVGLNLTAADTVILYDPWWNPAVEQQAIDRAYRIGQDKPVFVYKLVANATVEDRMLEMQSRKAGLADQLLSGVASDAALNADDFDELFKPLAPA